MALQLHFETAQGFIASAAYARIILFTGNKDSIMATVEVHKDAQARLDCKESLMCKNISLALPYGASMAQMYEALKLDSNFTNAVDC
jgi:hypothetical protein